jgi:CRP/FNR family transcriptional regulator
MDSISPQAFVPSSICRSCGAHRFCCPQGRGAYDAKTFARILKRKRVIKRGEYLFRTGDPFHSLYAVCEGAVKTYSLDREGAVQVTGFVIPGELAGVSGITHRRHVCNAVALQRTVVCEILCSRLEELRDQVPQLSRDLFELMGYEILLAQRQLAAVLGKKSATEKLAAFVCGLRQRYMEHGHTGHIVPLAMSRSDIAAYLGLTKETVCRLLARLESRNVIGIQRRCVEVADGAALRQLAGGCLDVDMPGDLSSSPGRRRA